MQVFVINILFWVLFWWHSFSADMWHWYSTIKYSLTILNVLSIIRFAFLRARRVEVWHPVPGTAPGGGQTIMQNSVLMTPKLNERPQRMSPELTANVLRAPGAPVGVQGGPWHENHRWHHVLQGFVWQTNRKHRSWPQTGLSSKPSSPPRLPRL